MLSAVPVTYSKSESENIEFPQPLRTSAPDNQPSALSCFEDPGSPAADDPLSYLSAEGHY